MKRNTYIILTMLCILLVILVNNLPEITSSASKIIPFKIDKEITSQTPPARFLIIFSLIYAAIFLTGLINIITSVARKGLKRIFTGIGKKCLKFPVSEKTSAKLIFLISFSSLIVSLSAFAMYLLQWTSISLFLLMNMLFQSTIIFLILKYLKPDFLGLSINLKNFLFSLKIYTVVLPIALMALLLNIFLADKLGVEYSLEPAIELLLLLKRKIQLFIFILEAVILGPIAEELLFRGFLYRLLRSKYSFAGSAVLISLFFSIMHRTPQNILPLFVISFGLCYLYEKTKSVFAPFVFHSLHNLISLILFLAVKNFFRV
ncbi:MAG: type II CAAX endopeptidase family protein [Candidatus Omnitrophica bacterium]|nr:type II CAAX endopeptidase family protein [Candidatus Omnitrophota bacterium]MDD5429786.1 type II CAAX endopeptidase family protein [Candidatus Omnitrophota bacterium]